MTKEEIKKKIKDLGIISIEDANNWQTMEDVIKIIEETNKSPKMIAAPLVIDAETDRKLFNTREKILSYFSEKRITDISIQREILVEAMKIDSEPYIANQTEEQILESDIKMYLTYAWINNRQHY